MSSKYYEEGNTTSALRAFVMWQMLRGMGWAALFVLANAVILGAIYGISTLLPADSKAAPSPYSQMLIAPMAQTDLA